MHMTNDIHELDGRMLTIAWGSKFSENKLLSYTEKAFLWQLGLVQLAAQSSE